MTSYKGLLNKIEAFCNAHLQIKKYGGEFKEQMPNFSTEDEKYPIVYVVPTSDLSDLNTNQFTLDVYCVDIIQKDRANINTVISDCNLIINDLYLYFLDGNDLSIDVIGASSGTPINNFDLDYSAGWVKSITFEVQSYSVCAIPMNPINPNPPIVCDPAIYNLIDTLDNILASGSINSGATENILVQDSIIKNSDESYVVSLTAQSALDLPNIKVTDSDGSTYEQPSVIDVVCTYVPPCEDASYNLKNTNGQQLSSGTIPSGGTSNITAPDSLYSVNNTLNTPLYSGNIPSGTSDIIVIQDATVENSDASYSVSILAEGSLTLPDITINVQNTLGTTVTTTTSPSAQDVVLGAPDGTINIKKTGDGTISSQSVPSGATIDYSVADNAITVNSANSFTIDATDPLDIVLKDTTGATVTPTSVTPHAGTHHVDIVLPANVQLYNSAELTRTGQTTSYATGDDGDLEKGRGGSFFLLPYNSPFGNTNRFTSDNFSAQTTYTNNIVIDWSTYNGSTVLGYRRTIMPTAVWATQVANCLGLSFGGYTSGWRLCNVQEYQNIANYSLSQTFNYAPFNLTTTGYQHTSTTDPGSTNSALKFYNPGGWCLGDSKLNTATAIACRTFTVTGTTLS